MKKEKEIADKQNSQLNQIIITTKIRPNGTRRIQRDFSNCPTLAEQHTAHLTNINYLMEKYKPDELAAYIVARNQYREEIIGHDFTKEPSLQDANNVIAQSRRNFEELPDEVKYSFKNHVEFLKYIDNPQNVEIMVKNGVLTKKQIDAVKIEEPSVQTTTTTKTKDKEHKE